MIKLLHLILGKEGIIGLSLFLVANNIVGYSLTSHVTVSIVVFFHFISFMSVTSIRLESLMVRGRQRGGKTVN